MPEGTPKQTTRTRAPKADVIDQFTAALDLPAEDPQHQKVAAFLDAAVEKRAAELGADRPRNIVEALVAVMRLVSHLGKDDRNEQGNFNFRGIDATINVLGPAMREVGVIPHPEVLAYTYGEVEVGRNRTKQAHAQVQVRYHFHYSNAAGELSSISADVPGEAMDSGDKATAKAMSVAMRIALLQTFALPTTEPDPDAYSYQRSDAPITTANDIYAAVGWAAKEDDYVAAFAVLRERFGAELFSVTCVNRAGEEVRADKYLDAAEAQTAEFRARNAAEAQDADAQGTTRDVAEEPAQDARAQQDDGARADAPEDARTEEPPARAPEAAQEPEARAQQAPPTETRDQKMTRLAREELVYHADALQVNLLEYAKPILATEGDLTSIQPHLTVGFLVGQRPQVIAALRDAGRATEAEAYARKGDGFPILLEDVTEAEGFTREPVEEPARA